ncbi:hypothetical protein DFH08DRAFT_885693 [Mycena albidolilacea]|uniref:Uncharacterized protein n=1 Tax=Mycena albidolilacea TaxID=1033008 RepID=A0AAD6ZK64_9AGAR|nr:hypothetical protein DFH08DRAFT_885693 [Mycena albidolilacea]
MVYLLRTLFPQWLLLFESIFCVVMLMPRRGTGQLDKTFCIILTQTDSFCLINSDTMAACKRKCPICLRLSLVQSNGLTSRNRSVQQIERL